MHGYRPGQQLFSGNRQTPLLPYPPSRLAAKTLPLGPRTQTSFGFGCAAMNSVMGLYSFLAAGNLRSWAIRTFGRTPADST